MIKGPKVSGRIWRIWFFLPTSMNVSDESVRLSRAGLFISQFISYKSLIFNCKMLR